MTPKNVKNFTRQVTGVTVFVGFPRQSGYFHFPKTSPSIPRSNPTAWPGKPKHDLLNKYTVLDSIGICLIFFNSYLKLPESNGRYPAISTFAAKKSPPDYNSPHPGWHRWIPTTSSPPHILVGGPGPPQPEKWWSERQWRDDDIPNIYGKMQNWWQPVTTNQYYIQNTCSTK